MGEYSPLLAFGDVPGRLYGFNSRTSEHGFRRFEVDDDGVRLLSLDYKFLGPVGASRMEVVDGLVYFGDGTVADGEEREVVGQYPRPLHLPQFPRLFAVEPAPDLGRALFLAEATERVDVVAYVDSTFGLLADERVPHQGRRHDRPRPVGRAGARVR